MPRASSASLETVIARIAPKRISPPENLSAGAADIFRAVVGSVDPEHFRPCDLPLMVEYARAADLANTAAAGLDAEGAIVNGRANPYLIVQEKATRALTALSARLRICPQSRFDREKASTNAKQKTIPAPWHDAEANGS